MKILLSAIITLAGSFCFATSIPQARASVATIANETNQLVGSCEQITPSANNMKHQLSDLAASFNSFVKVDAQEVVLKDVSSAISAVNIALNDCADLPDQAPNYGKELLEMYLQHIDIDLMVLQHGVGSDQKRKTN